MAEENNKKTEPKTTTKQMFVKGGKPGPGRGHKKENPIIMDGELLDAIEQVVRTGLGAKELKDRLKAAGIGIRVQSMKKSDDIDIGYDSFITRFLHFVYDIANARFNKTGIPTSAKDVLIEMCEVCANCERLRTKSINPDFEIVE